LDWFIGKGIYLFFNFKNWRLTKHSKSITYVHDMSFKVFPESLKPNLRGIMNRHLPEWIKRTDKVIVVSNHAATELQRYYPDITNIEIIHNGVDHTIYRQYDQEEIRKNNMAFNLKCPYFLYVGNIEPRKNIGRLLDAYKHINPSLAKHSELVIVGGKGWKSEAVFHQIEDLRKSGMAIRIMNAYVSDDNLALLYNGALALLHPALYEGFGLTPLQAMACGTPVVVGNTSSLPEVAGPAGIYCNPEDVNTITTAIEYAAAKSDNEPFKKLLIQQASFFSWQTSAKKLLQLMNSFSE
jgi:glycosyltransferase involved in cell wall biosynthesis